MLTRGLSLTPDFHTLGCHGYLLCLIFSSGPRPLLPWAHSLSPVFSHLLWTPGSGPAWALGSTTGVGCPFSPSVWPLLEPCARSLAPPAVAFRPRVPCLLCDWAQPPSVSQALSHLFQSPIPPSFTKARCVLREPVCGSASRDAAGGVDGPPGALGQHRPGSLCSAVLAPALASPVAQRTALCPPSLSAGCLRESSCGWVYQEPGGGGRRQPSNAPCTNQPRSLPPLLAAGHSGCFRSAAVVSETAVNAGARGTDVLGGESVVC